MPPTGAASEAVQRQVDLLRKKLLDLTMRNRMLNYRVSKRLGIDVIGEDSFYLHKLLVEDGKKMSFVGRPDPPRKETTKRSLFENEDAVAISTLRAQAEDELNAFLVDPVVPVDQLDTKLNTEEYESVLQAKLRTMQREAYLANEELGINTLFLTLGMLEWSDTAEKTYRAPLLFVPVTLEKQANGTIRLLHDGNDVGTNLPLRAKLQELNLRLPDFDEEKGVMDYLSAVESTIHTREDWHVHRDQVCLGFFNYEKYAMYVDLGGDAWPDDRKPWDNPDLRAMLGGGYPTTESAVTDESFLDAIRPVAESREVFDADASQTIAMIRAAEGLSVVVEGPPGTGKSQTITNIIAESVAAGKTVLFVSAKRAALDVVKRNLERADLGPMCLDLHDKMTNRREFYAEIKRTVGRAVTVQAEEEKVARLTELRDRLNGHSAAVNEILPEFGCTPFAAMSLLAGLPKEEAADREGRIPFERLRHWTLTEIQTRMPLVEAMQIRLVAVGVPQEHPFWGATIDYLDPARRLDLEQDLDAARAAFAQAMSAWTVASEALRVEVTPTADNARVLRVCAERALSAPALDGIAVKAATWKTDESAVRTTVAALKTRQEIRTRLQGVVRPEIWEMNLGEIESAYRRHAGSWYRVLVGSFRQAKGALDGLLQPTATTDPGDRLALVEDVRRAQSAEAEVRSHEDAMRRLFGAQWQGLASDLTVLERLLAWVLDLHDKVAAGQIPAGLLDFFAATHSDGTLLAKVEAAERTAEAAVAAYGVVAELLQFPHEDSRSEDWQVLTERLTRWQDALPRLPDYISYTEARRQALARELLPVVEVADRWPLAEERLANSFLRSYLSGVVREAMQRRPELRTFERSGHEAAIAEFRTLDDFKLRYNRAQVRLAHHRRLPTFENAIGNLQLLKMQSELQRRHKPIRWIMSRAGEAIQRIKPVFMMSPLSVAIHLPPEMPPFDLVIFDEASQIKPEDALCAIARAKQCIVVGDTRQMPPTSFFDRMVDDEEEDEVDPEMELGQEARKLESVLSLMSAVVLGRARRPDLRWHYRSVHPSLIQPSNEMFYENRLIVFPSPGEHQAGRRIGMVFQYHPETVYEAGAKNRVNRREAELVADRVLEHVRTDPEESLLVAAMNKPQADLIYDEVAKRERLDPAPFAQYRANHPHEPLDVKNLETVQGDERDVILVSVTYGRDASGAIRQQFGPLLQDGGERRLNVLFTRARRRCEVFSNLSADDIRLDGPRPGVQALKRYLRFAETGVLDTPIPTGGGEESPFEEEVTAALRELGYEVHCQVGSEGFRIDIGVLDRERPGRYVLGIECDGATYHSARSARDRDKLRQRVLESRGWRLHRIWSHDWWQDREGEIRRLIEAIEAPVEEAESPPEAASVPPVMLQEVDEGREAAPLTRPYVETPLSAIVRGEDELAAHMAEVVKTEGPIHRDLLFIRLRDASGYESARASTREWLDGVIDRNLPRFRQSGDGIFAEDAQLAQPRDWSARPPTEKKTDYLTEAELSSALRAVIGRSFGVSREDASRSALRVLGFKRASDPAVAKVGVVLDRLIAAGEIVRGEDGALTLRKGEI